MTAGRRRQPTWLDISESRDAARDARHEIEVAAIARGTRLILLHGAAGSGKTTILKRLAFDASIGGHRVFWASDEQRLELDALIKAELKRDAGTSQTYVFVDVACRYISSIEYAIGCMPEDSSICVVAADRTFNVAKHEALFAALGAKSIQLQDLSADEIDRILERLDHFRFLGKLEAMTPQSRKELWRIKSKRQLLVAMKETTQGKGFDQIIEDEYSELSAESKLAYVICCLAVSQGAPGVYRRHLLASFGKATFSKGRIVSDLLQGVLFPANESGTMLTVRHRVIAKHVAMHAAKIGEKREAIIRYLTAIAPEVSQVSARASTPYFRGYVGLVNSRFLLEAFAGESETVKGIYEELASQYRDQYLFWMHYGRTYAQLGDLETARVFFQQAEGICDRQGASPFQIRHQLGILHLVQAVNTGSYDLGKQFADEGEEILDSLIDNRGQHDSYPYVAYLEYMARWYLIARDHIVHSQWEKLRNTAKIATESYRLEHRVAQAAKRVEEAYLLKETPNDEIDAVIRDFLAKSKLSL